ncbi:MAG TPA: amidohydrolase [Candidatus Polarisedimenticolia bacterium]|nr:amidohydrolase [Candidatus Polarisedimenticolia bacterium]
MRTASLILTRGKIHTLDPALPEATAIALAGDRILKVGSDKEIAALVGPGTRKIDLQGKTVIPGLIDAHLHLAGIGEWLENLDLKGLPTPVEAVKLVEEAAAKTAPGGWILGRGWDQNLWPVPEFPTAAMLDAVSGDHPVSLKRVDGHALWANSKALEAAGITRTTPNPPGGRILHDEKTAQPSGILLDDAMNLVERKIPPTTPETVQRRIVTAGRQLLATGITSVHDAGIEPADIDLYMKMVEEGSLPVRVYAMLGGSNRKLTNYFAREPLIGYGDRRFTFRAIKVGVDGALGSRGAALLEPYSDDPKNSGILTMPGEQLEQLTREALQKGFQMCVHAIGDRGNRTALDRLEAALKAVPTKDARLRIEHAQILSPTDLPRFAQIGILASMQPTHATSDMPWVPARLGPDRLAGAYAWKSILDSGAHLSFGSDAPIESWNPFKGLFAAVTREDESLNPQGGWLPEQRLTREEALRAFTVGAAYAAFEEGEKGTLTAGKLADLVVLDRDYFQVPEEEIFKIVPERTILGGVEVYTREPERP